VPGRTCAIASRIGFTSIAREKPGKDGKKGSLYFEDAQHRALVDKMRVELMNAKGVS